MHGADPQQPAPGAGADSPQPAPGPAADPAGRGRAVDAAGPPRRGPGPALAATALAVAAVAALAVAVLAFGLGESGDAPVVGGTDAADGSASQGATSSAEGGAGADDGAEGADGPVLPLVGGDGEQALLADDRPTAVLAWASWCPHCNRVMPGTAELPEMLGDRVAVVGISTMERDDPAGEAAAFVDRHGLTTYPHLLDVDSRVATAVGVSGVPALVVIEPDGTVIDRQVGLPDDPAEIADRVEQSL